MYICLCNGVSDREICKAVEEGACSVEEIMYCTGAGTRCGSCIPEIEELLEANAEDASASSHRHLNVLPPSATSAA